MSTARATDTGELSARRRLSEADRIRLVQEAAEALFLRDGYGNATMDEVAQLVGMSKRTLYQLYPSKAALFEAVMQDCLCPFALDQALENAPDLAAALTGMLVVAARHLFQPRQVAIFRLVIAEVNRAPELADAFHRVGPGRGASGIERRLAAEIAAGRLAMDDAKQAAHVLFGMALGAAHMFLLLGVQGPPTEAELQQQVAEAVRVFLDGAVRRPG